MTPEQIVAHCQRQQELQNKPDATVVLYVRGSWGKRDTRRPWPGGPVCRIVGEAPNRRLVLMCRADEILTTIADKLRRIEQERSDD